MSEFETCLRKIAAGIAEEIITRGLEAYGKMTHDEQAKIGGTGDWWPAKVVAAAVAPDAVAQYVTETQKTDVRRVQRLLPRLSQRS